MNSINNNMEITRLFILIQQCTCLLIFLLVFTGVGFGNYKRVSAQSECPASSWSEGSRISCSWDCSQRDSCADGSGSYSGQSATTGRTTSTSIVCYNCCSGWAPSIHGRTGKKLRLIPIFMKLPKIVSSKYVFIPLNAFCCLGH